MGPQIIEQAGAWQSGHQSGDDRALGFDVEDLTAQKHKVAASAEEDMGGG
jgi:hypothetical protein